MLNRRGQWKPCNLIGPQCHILLMHSISFLRQHYFYLGFFRLCGLAFISVCMDGCVGAQALKPVGLLQSVWKGVPISWKRGKTHLVTSRDANGCGMGSALVDIRDSTSARAIRGKQPCAGSEHPVN